MAIALTEFIIPWFSVPGGLESGNGRHFVSKVVQDVCKIQDIPWFLHSSYRPQDSTKVERMNRILKMTIAYSNS